MLCNGLGCVNGQLSDEGSLWQSWRLCFDHQKSRDSVGMLDISSPKGHKYIRYALPGYTIGFVAALAAWILTHSPQPALLYLVPSTLGPVVVLSWLKKELLELWEGTRQNLNEKSRLPEV
ncbi:signal peptide peptidase-like 1 [Telopea speciosissima]|uniref:signal peptide peptidase-like 1 n=1 Tax=Telopea speciosissima TaxID=54955 RepID=UPI001CC6E9DC|nr:signal peptide peptidase-like 1 [Telopea speciosissima]